MIGATLSQEVEWVIYHVFIFIGQDFHTLITYFDCVGSGVTVDADL